MYKRQEVASDDVPPTANPVPLEAYLRPDVAETPLTQEEALAEMCIRDSACCAAKRKEEAVDYPLFTKLAAEFFGTAILMIFGNGSVARCV